MSDVARQALDHVADYFLALADPTRLRMLRELQGGERSVGQLALLCNCSSANVSRHLSRLSGHGLVERTRRGTSAYYRIGDPLVFALCDLVCGGIASRHAQAARAAQPFTRIPFTQGERA